MQLYQHPLNETSWFRCPLKLISNIFRLYCSVKSLIRFQTSHESTLEHGYISRWDNLICKNYTNSDTHRNSVLLDLYSDCTTMSQFGARSPTFSRVWLVNIDSFYQRWFMVAIAPASRKTLSSLPVEQQPELRLELMHRFIFMFQKPN